ncbi:dimethylargininase [uncultured Friedmanniella sp.]|uniref:dimethylargininase n=1 Tax=uncultured Friedmanniella sp. TaxID=335381 RepID=UPI0035CAEE19
MTSSVLARPTAVVRRPSPRHYLMCPPTFFDVSYAINPWMRPGPGVERELALAQWSGLAQSYRAAGHRVDLLSPVPGLPDMVYAANGATVVDGYVLQARFATVQRAAEAAHHGDWHAAGGRRVTMPEAVNEAEGDFAVLADRLLAGYGFRTSPDAHAELARLTGRPVVSLQLVDPYFYHLDVALTVLDDARDHVAYYPSAFSPASQAVLAELFPDALVADAGDAACLGLNCVSDGRNVWVPAGADHLTGLLAEAGYEPHPVDLSELLRGGGSVKCCTQEIRPRRTHHPKGPAPC